VGDRGSSDPLEILGALIAVYGVFVTAIGREYALWMWGYAMVWFVLNNMVKMLAYRLLRARGGVLANQPSLSLRRDALP